MNSEEFLSKTGLTYYHNRIKTQFASKSEVPTKTSDLTNDSNFITGADIPISITQDGKLDIIELQSGGDNSVSMTVVNNGLDYEYAYGKTTLASKDYVDANGGKIQKIKVNGTEQTIDTADKSVNITVPTKVSDITNDSGYQNATQVQTLIDASIVGAYKYKGSVANRQALPSNAENGDVYDLQDTGMNVAWNGTSWDDLGQLVDTSLLWAKSELTAITTAEIDTITA